MSKNRKYWYINRGLRKAAEAVPIYNARKKWYKTTYTLELYTFLLNRSKILRLKQCGLVKNIEAKGASSLLDGDQSGSIAVAFLDLAKAFDTAETNTNPTKK